MKYLTIEACFWPDVREVTAFRDFGHDSGLPGGVLFAENDGVIMVQSGDIGLKQVRSDKV